MKKFAISLIALAAISTASFASERGSDLRDSDTYFGKYSTQLKNTATNVNALVVIKKASAVTNSERLLRILEEKNDQGRQ